MTIEEAWLYLAGNYGKVKFRKQGFHSSQVAVEIKVGGHETQTTVTAGNQAEVLEAIRFGCEQLRAVIDQRRGIT